jgi:renalase
MRSHDLIVVGAGIAGLACAREASARGLSPVVLERSRGVGGRCATHRLDGQPVDHGVPFLHGSESEFLAEWERVDAERIVGWPRVLRGEGPPCQPNAFAPRERRVAFAAGISSFAKHLARGLVLRLGSRVAGIGVGTGGIRVTLEDGDVLEARRAVLALPVEQARAHLASLPDPAVAVRAVAHLLAPIGSRPCLTVIAGYPGDAPVPDWELWHPEESKVLQTLVHDSSKRKEPRRRVLVLQAPPCWSRQHLDLPPEEWTAEVVREAGRLAGDWAARPEVTRPQRWRYARADGGSELSLPVLLDLDGATLGIAGECFAPGGGTQAAYLSGVALASRLTG